MRKHVAGSKWDVYIPILNTSERVYVPYLERLTQQRCERINDLLFAMGIESRTAFIKEHQRKGAAK